MNSRDERSIGELFAELSRETTALLRSEIALAKAEMSQKATSVGIDIGLLVAGGAVAYAGFLALIAGLVFALALVIPLWLSAFAVGLLVAGVGGILVARGLQRLKQVRPQPEQTMETLKEDKEWLKNQKS